MPKTWTWQSQAPEGIAKARAVFGCDAVIVRGWGAAAAGSLPRAARASRRFAEGWARGTRVGLAGGFEIDPHAADAGAMHLVERGIRRPIVDHRHTASPGAELAHAVERAGIVAGVDARLDDHDARQAQRLLQGEQLVRVGRRRGIAAASSSSASAGGGV